MHLGFTQPHALISNTLKSQAIFDLYYKVQLEQTFGGSSLFSILDTIDKEHLACHQSA